MSSVAKYLPQISSEPKEGPRLNRPTHIDVEGLAPNMLPYATLVAQIRQAPETSRGSCLQTIGIIGCHAHDNASRICDGLAETAAIMLQQRVLVVATRSKQQLPAMLEKAQPANSDLGHNEFLAGNCALDDCIRPTPHKDLYRLPASLGRVSARAFNPSTLQQGVERCRTQFALTFFDMAMLNSAENNVGLLTTHLDGVILVIAPNRTQSEVIRKCTLDLSRFGAKLLGAVIAEST